VIGSLKPILRRAIKFGVTGVFVTACHAAYAVTAIEMNGWTPPEANGAAFVFATQVSYLLNTRWSFSRRPTGRTFVRFWMVCGLGLLQSVAIASAVERASLPYPLGILLISVTLPPVSFLLHSLWTYRERPPAAALPVPPPRPPAPAYPSARKKPGLKPSRRRRQTSR
jgi:putative flippase GtrA